MSPSKQSQKQGDLIGELLGFIKKSGLKLPSNIEKAMTQDSDSILRLTPTNQSPKQT